MTAASRTIQLGLACMAGLFGATVWAGAVVSGLVVGKPTPSIPVMDVTGPYAGKRICYVCEFQDDPNVIAFFRDAGQDTAELIVQLDELYRQHSESGFKVVAIIAAGTEATPWLTELDASRSIDIPLAVLPKGPKDVGNRLYELNPEARNTFLVTVNRAVHTNVADIAPSEFSQIAGAVADMLGNGGAKAL